MTQTVTILKGLPASGKSTWAKEQVEKSEGRIKRVNKDDLRAMIDAGKWSKDRENFIVTLRDDIITKALVRGHSVIVDDTNLAPKHVHDIQKLVESLNEILGQKCRVEINDTFCQVPLRECIRRDALRPSPVGRDVINRMSRQFGVGVPDPYFIPDLRSAVICDLDGTLALIGNRDPYDASTCEEDKINEPVKRFLKSVFFDNEIFLFSGREQKYEEPTRRWLERHDIDFEHLVMRPTGNFEKDSIIKTRMFEEHIRGKFNVHVVLDDRQQVVDTWRDLGLNVWQVNEGNF